MRRSLIGMAGTLLVLSTPSAQGAATRYAEPGGNGAAGPGQCLEADPCSLQEAVAGRVGQPNDVVNGDEVVVLAGPYTETTQIFASDNITVHGQAGQPRPVINSNVSTAFGTNVGATFRHLQIEHTGAFGAFQVFPGNAEDMVIHSVSGYACSVSGDSVTIKNSVCWTQGSAAAGLLAGGGISDVITLRNVSVFATGSPNTDAMRFSSSGGSTTVATVSNVIAQATADPPESPLIADIEVLSDGASSATTVTVDHSNYEDVNQFSTNGGVASITPNTASGNQGAVPLVADPATGDFHQVLGSPTIDAGIVNPANGTTDLDGEPRQIGASTDIGVDEFPDADSDGIPDSSDACPNQAGPASNSGCPIPEPEEPPSSDTTPPDTTITAGPEGRTKKKSATVTFSGSDARVVASFQCRLDADQFESCSSPKTYSGLKKSFHTVEVRAVDAAGNVDPTPATRSWKVKKKRKRP